MTDLSMTLAAHATILLTYIVGQVFQWMRETRHHRWQREELGAIRSNLENGNHIQERE